VRDNYDAFHKEIDTMYEPHFCAKNFHYLAMQLPIKAGTYKIKKTLFSNFLSYPKEGKHGPRF
jgi:hypothetical protein